MREIIFNPLTIWLIWVFRSRLVLLSNRKKHLKIGSLTQLRKVTLGNFNTFYKNVSVSNSTIGDYVYVGDRTIIGNTTIGKFCSIGSDVRIGLGMHPTDFISTFPAFFSTRKQCQITFADRDYYEENGRNEIGNDVWIGANAIILGNIKIGDGVIVGAGAVVTKDVDPYSVIGGVPAKLIKKRFPDEEINQLLKLRWWDSDIEWIKKNAALFNNPQDFFKMI